MTVVSGICFLIVFFILLSCIPKRADVLSPARVFSFVWALAIGLADLKLSGFQHTWTALAWSALLFGVIAFLLGIFVIYTITFGRKILSLEEVRSALRREWEEKIAKERFFILLLAVALLYLLAFSVEVIIEGNVPIFSQEPDRLRVSFGVFGIHLIVNLVVAILFLCAEHLVCGSVVRGKKIAIGFIILLVSGSFFLLLQRYHFFILAVMMMGLAYYASSFLRLRNALLVGSTLVVLFTSIQSLRAVRYVEQYVYVISRMKFSRQFAALTEPYMYLTMNLENFARAAERVENFYYGYFSLDWVTALSGLKHWMEEYFSIEPLPFLVSGYNTFPFLWSYYYDFGLIGVALFPFLTGIAVGWIYHRLRSIPTLPTLVLYVGSLAVMVISFMTNPLNRLEFVTNILLLLVVHFFSRVRSANRDFGKP